MPDAYPRDLLGYGRTPPDPRWPGGARIAVQFVLNYEEGGESSILHGDAASESFLTEIVGAQPWPGQRNLVAESAYEYGARAGFWRIWRLFTARRVPLTVYAVAMALARNPDAVAAMREADWEIASHGLRWIEYKDFAEADERRHLDEAIRLHAQATGARPLGWYLGRGSVNTRRLVMEEGGFLYDSDSYADDLPYWVAGPRGPHLVIPYALDANDMRFAAPQASIPAISSSPICATASTCCTRKARRRRKCCRSACTRASSAARAASRRSRASSITWRRTSACG